MSIKVSIGKSFKFPLESNLGSTPLGWCLKKMPEGVVLLYQENIPIRAMNSIQMFNFVVTAQIPSDNARLEFILIDFTTFEAKDTFSITVETVEQTTNEAGKNKFIEFAGNASANRANHTYNPANDYGVLPNNQFESACMNRFYDIMPRSAFNSNPACVDMMYYVQPRSAFQAKPACTPAVPYGVLPNNQFGGACMSRAYDMMPRSAFDNNPACVDMMYYVQPRSAFQAKPACTPAVPYGVLPNNQFDGACMSRAYEIMPRSAFDSNPACIDMMYYVQPRSAFQGDSACNPMPPYGVLPDNQFNGVCINRAYDMMPRSAFDGNPACVDMMYYVQPRSAFQGNPACNPAVPYGVLPNNQFNGACINRAYDMMPRSAFDGNPACIDMMYYMQPRSAFQGNPACNPAVPYGVLPNNQFNGACMNREYDIMPRSAFQSNPACIDMMYYMQPRSAFKE